MTNRGAPTSTKGLCLQQAWDDQIQVAAPGDQRPSSYLYRSEYPKACVHPLVTPRGHRLTGFEPSDHFWHRGLWFTIKYINKTNYWEEEPPFGVQKADEQPTAELISADAVRVTHDVAWTSEATGLVLSERRVLTFRRHEDNTRSIDWHTILTAAQDLTLDRTPFTTWGGYGGLSWRGAREIHQAKFMTPIGETVPEIAGEPHDWIQMQGLVDGGQNQHVALGIIDHPSNPRSPCPWYCKSGAFTFMNAAFLFHEPMEMARDETLEFAYRVLYRDGVWSVDEFAALADSFRGKAVTR